MSETQGVAKETGQESQGSAAGEIEYSGDAAVIADAIFGGLSEIAKAIRELAKSNAQDYEAEPEPEYYLDGKRK